MQITVAGQYSLLYSGMYLALSVKSMFSPVSPSSFSRFWSLSIEKTWSSNWTRTHTLQKCKLLDYTHVIAQCFSNRLRCIQSFCRYWISMRFRFSCYYTCIMVEIFNVFCCCLNHVSLFFKTVVSNIRKYEG